MISNTNYLLCAAALCCGVTVARADDVPAPAPVTEQTVEVVLAPGSEIGFPGTGLAVPVKNAPYSVDIIKERQQVLGDGNQIVQRTTAKAYRDSAGRTREESFDSHGEARTVLIKDPVAGVRWFINPKTKTATKTVLPPPGPAAFFKAPQDGKMHVLEHTMGSDGSERVVVKDPAPTVDSDQQQAPGRITVRMPPIRQPEDQGAGVFPQLNTLLSGVFGDMKWARRATKHALPPREIDGVRATGMVRSYEIPAGELGNRNAIVVSDEVWYATDLRITLSSKHSDPRTGDSLFRIENLKRDEPAPAMFTPPADYAVKDIAALRQGASDKKAQ